MGKTVTGIIETVIGVAMIVAAVVVPGAQFLLGPGIGLTLSGLQTTLSAKKPATTAASSTRLNKSLDPEAFRKIVFGKTCGGADLRYWEVYGTGDNQYDEVIAVAGHQINSFQQFYIETELIPFSGGTVTSGTYAGLFTRQTDDGTVGNAALTVGAGSKWTSVSKFRGSAHYALRWTYDQNKLPQGIPSRYTCVVEGALVYDPRKDTTVGGSGSHRYNDQTTWAYSTADSNGQPIGRNNALQVLWYMLGWRIQDTSGNQVLVAGRGVDPNDIDFSAFITAANDAEALQYYTDCILSTGDSHQVNESVLTADGVIGTLIDPGGLWTYFINKNDTGTVDVALTDDDVVDTGPVQWTPYKPLSDQYNRVVGTFVDPSATSLYQPKPYPQAVNTTYETADGFKKRKTANYQAVQDGQLAQKLSIILNNEGRWQGEFTAKFNFRSMFTRLYGVTTLTVAHYGFSAKLFRVLSMYIEPDGVTMRLGEVDSTIWTTGSLGTVTTTPTGGNGSTSGAIPLTGVAVNPIAIITSGATYPALRVTWSAVPSTVSSIQVRYRPTGTTPWVTGPQVTYDAANADLLSLAALTGYDVQTQTVSVFGVRSGWSSTITQSTGGYVAPPSNTGGNLLSDGDFSGGTGAALSGSWTASAGAIRNATL